MKQKKIQAIIVTVLILLAIAVSVSAVLIKKYSPGKEAMDLKTYYNLSNDEESVIILQDKIYDQKAVTIDDNIYIDYDTVIKEFNKKFYFDEKENLLIFTTPTEVIKSDAGSKDYYINKRKKSADYPITKLDGDKVYIALDFVKQYSNIKYEIYENPSRLVIEHKFGENLYANVKKKTQIRYKAGIKSEILAQLNKNDKVQFIDTAESAINGFSKVMTKDGIIGYVKTKYVKNTYYETAKSDYKEPDYTSIHKDYKINLVWHQVTNQTANNNLLNNLDMTKGINTISPTWFSVISDEGDISSLASDDYVKRAHNLGLEVWGLVDDFNPDMKMHNLLTSTSKRENLVNNIAAKAIQHDLDGINIDFENIKKDTAVHYLQFLRELSIKCRNNGVVLSVDNAVPTEYSAYYDRKEQASVVDYVITMAYDEHHRRSEISGSVASYPFVKKGIEDTLAEVPKEKTIIALPFYTRLWMETKDGDKVKVTSKDYGMTGAENLLKQNKADIEWNEEARQNYGEFRKDGAVFKVWLEDERSLEEKLKLVKEHDVAGVAGWKLGLQKNSVWDIIVKYIS